MYQIRKYFTILLPIAFALFSCDSGTANKTDVASTDSTKTSDTAQTMSASNEFKPFVALVRTFDVKDFVGWKKVFDDRVARRDSIDLQTIAVARDLDNPSHILTVFKVPDLQLIKKYFASDDMQKAVKLSGVSTEPDNAYFNVVRFVPSSTETHWVQITHKVKDYDAWLKVFDTEGSQSRLRHGLIDAVIARGIDDDKLVHLVFNFKEQDLAKVKARMNSDELKSLMITAGVEGKPEMNYYGEVEN